jgi:arylsulfatase A-like enzyme
MQDLHSGGTVCSPTRATILTGRNHFRDCVSFVYGCSDMTECVPQFNFAPEKTFTIAHAVRAANKNYASQIFGKWHLGSLYDDSEKYGGISSSPVTHGFDHFNMTVEVAPTLSTNCQCNQEWSKECDLGHYKKPTHCSRNAPPGTSPAGWHPNPGGGNLTNGCCFNYWTENASAPHGVQNNTTPTPLDDSLYLADSFTRFIESRKGAPFLAQISFHNCHVPFIGTPDDRKSCAAGETCKPPVGEPSSYTDAELDFYGCMIELDRAIGEVLGAMDRLGYGENTMTWLATDNGPEYNCPPAGICGGTEHRPIAKGTFGGPGSAGPLRGRKRDIWEGGHRVPGIISWPAVVKGKARENWDTVVTMDFLATIMEVLAVERPAGQETWAFDGVSVLPILRGEPAAPRGIGWIFDTPVLSVQKGYGYRYGKWKYVQGSVSCAGPTANTTCQLPMLYDLESDLGERNDVSAEYPDVLKAIMANFTLWHESVMHSIDDESKCGPEFKTRSLYDEACAAGSPHCPGGLEQP